MKILVGYICGLEYDGNDLYARKQKIQHQQLGKEKEEDEAANEEFYLFINL